MAEINPLAFIGSSNDPSLTKRVTDASASSDALQRGLAQIASKGKNADRLAGITGKTSRDVAAMGQGFTGMSDPNFQSGSDAKRNAGISLKENQGIQARLQGFGSLANFTGLNPALKDTLDLNELMGNKVTILPGQPTSVGSSAATGLLAEESKNVNKVDIDDVINADSGEVLSPLAKRKRSNTTSKTQKSKSGTPAGSGAQDMTEMRNFLTANPSIIPARVIRRDGKVYIQSIDGRLFEVD